MGTAMMLALIAVSITIFVKIERRTLLAIIGCCTMIIPIMWFVLKDYQKQRILTFLNPDRGSLGSGLPHYTVENRHWFRYGSRQRVFEGNPECAFFSSRTAYGFYLFRNCRGMGVYRSGASAGSFSGFSDLRTEHRPEMPRSFRRCADSGNYGHDFLAGISSISVW